MNNDTTTVDLNEFDDWDLAKMPVQESSANPLVQKPDLSYLDEPVVEDPIVIADPVEETILSKEEAAKVLESLTEDPIADPVVDELDKPKKGKDALVDFLKENIEGGDYINYSDYQEGEDLSAYLSKLTVDELKGLHKENINRIRKEESSKGPEEFLQTLDPKIQAAIYYSQLGQDPTPYLQAQYQLEDVKNADLDQESVQESIVRTHLTNSNFGTPEDIEVEIQNFKDLGTLETRAKKFHPQLVKLDEARIQQMEQRAQYEEQQRNLQYQSYTQGVHQALSAGELAGIKLDRKTQESLYYGLITPQYPDRNGNPTNELGSLLDRYQFIEPDYGVLAEVTLFLRNPEEYREKIRQQGANKNTEQTVRQLKTEQARHLQPQEQTPAITNTRPSIQRKGNIFQRPKV